MKRTVLLTALGASAGCENSACDQPGKQVALSLHHAELRDNDPRGDQLMFATDPAVGDALFAEVGLTVPMPDLGDRLQLIIYQGEMRDRYDLPIFTRADEVGGRLLLRVVEGSAAQFDTGFGLGLDTGPTSWILTVWTVDSQLNPVTCGD